MNGTEKMISRWRSKRFPGFDVEFNRDSLLDPIELLISHERIEELVEPTFQLWCNAAAVEGIVTPGQLALLNGTIVGLAARLPKWARDLWKLRRAEWASKER